MAPRFDGQTLTVDWSQAIGHECSLELNGWSYGVTATVIRGAEVEPITEQIELIKEGREMRHCIASHLSSVVSGDYAVYRMLKPERLTIEIVVADWGQCFLKEVRGKGNRLPATASMEIIREWFLEFQPNASDVSVNFINAT